jgi:hypothetical protein
MNLLFCFNSKLIKYLARSCGVERSLVAAGQITSGAKGHLSCCLPEMPEALLCLDHKARI